MNSAIPSSFSRQRGNGTPLPTRPYARCPSIKSSRQASSTGHKYTHDITQDAHYMIGFGRALALAAAKAPQPDRIVQFAITRNKWRQSAMIARVRSHWDRIRKS